MKNRRIISLLLTLVMVIALCGCQSAKTEEPAAMTDEEIIDMFYDNFLKVAAIPRPSGHEGQIAEFLAGWASGHGAENVTRDASRNLIFDLPATQGFEDLPPAVVQGHLDMVCVSEEGLDFDMLTDPIKVIRDDRAGTLTAEGTSLGADNGVGLAIIMAVTEGKMSHGPLRIVLTANEEVGMTGASGLSPDVLAGYEYLINIDSEEAGSVTLSSAGVRVLTASGQPEVVKPAGNTALDLEIKGLRGGHSGVDINDRRLNGILAVARLLDEMKRAGVDYELVSFAGGTAANAIPFNAKARVMVKSGDVDQVRSLADELLKELQKEYEGSENEMQLLVSETDRADEALSEAERDRVLQFLLGIPNGVNNMSEKVEGLVESSTNLGLIQADVEGISVVVSSRSSDESFFQSLVDQETNLAEDCGFTCEIQNVADPWPYDPDNRLLPVIRSVFEEQNGKKIREVSVHGGLECGAFSKMNPDLDIISFGPQIDNAHSTSETLHLSTVPETWRLLEGVLQALPQ